MALARTVKKAQIALPIYKKLLRRIPFLATFEEKEFALATLVDTLEVALSRPQSLFRIPELVDSVNKAFISALEAQDIAIKYYPKELKQIDQNKKENAGPKKTGVQKLAEQLQANVNLLSETFKEAFKDKNPMDLEERFKRNMDAFYGAYFTIALMLDPLFPEKQEQKIMQEAKSKNDYMCLRNLFDEDVEYTAIRDLNPKETNNRALVSKQAAKYFFQLPSTVQKIILSNHNAMMSKEMDFAHFGATACTVMGRTMEQDEKLHAELWTSSLGNIHAYAVIVDHKQHSFRTQRLTGRTHQPGPPTDPDCIDEHIRIRKHLEAEAKKLEAGAKKRFPKSPKWLVANSSVSRCYGKLNIKSFGLNSECDIERYITSLAISERVYLVIVSPSFTEYKNLPSQIKSEEKRCKYPRTKCLRKFQETLAKYRKETSANTLGRGRVELEMEIGREQNAMQKEYENKQSLERAIGAIVYYGVTRDYSLDALAQLFSPLANGAEDSTVMVSQVSAEPIKSDLYCGHVTNIVSDALAAKANPSFYYETMLQLEAFKQMKTVAPLSETGIRRLSGEPFRQFQPAAAAVSGMALPQVAVDTKHSISNAKNS